MSREKLYLFETDSCSQYASVQAVGLDIHFPPEIGGWTDVLDCREEPYTERSLAENCAYAIHVRKKYIVVAESQLSQESPALDEG
ncbi:MAG: hypothetical protein ACNA8W_04730 [Bradymonadaceae bacterium]